MPSGIELVGTDYRKTHRVLAPLTDEAGSAALNLEHALMRGRKQRSVSRIRDQCVHVRNGGFGLARIFSWLVRTRCGHGQHEAGHRDHGESTPAVVSPSSVRARHSAEPAKESPHCLSKFVIVAISPA